MSSWPAHLQRRWFAVARSDRVGKKPLAVTVLDRPIVLARLGGREIAAFEDRCPHRQAPLSAGRLIGGTLQCPYHGWRFDQSGALCEIPGANSCDRLPGVRARTLGVIEHDGLVWVRLDPSGSLSDLPERIRALQPKQRRFLWQTCWNANIVDALENVLDPLHTHFIHAGIVRRAASRRAITAHCTSTSEGFTVDYRGNDAQSGLVYRLFESSREAERAHFSAPGSAELEYVYRNGSRARVALHFTPASPTRTHLFGSLHVEGRYAPAWAVRMLLWPFIRRIAQQDARILALQASNLERFTERRDIITRYDLVRQRLEQAWTNDSAMSNPPPKDEQIVLML